MNPLDKITEDRIRKACGDTIFERAFQYVGTPVLRRRRVWPALQQLAAEIRGEYGTYEVSFRPLENAEFEIHCTCPAEMYFCKHVAALAITWIHEPETFYDMDSLSAMLKKKSREELEELILYMLTKHPEALSLLGAKGFEEEEAAEDDYNDYYEDEDDV